MIEPHLVEEKDPLKHCMFLEKMAFSMMKMNNFLRNPYLGRQTSEH